MALNKGTLMEWIFFALGFLSGVLVAFVGLVWLGIKSKTMRWSGVTVQDRVEKDPKLN